MKCMYVCMYVCMTVSDGVLVYDHGLAVHEVLQRQLALAAHQTIQLLKLGLQSHMYVCRYVFMRLNVCI